MSDAQSETEDQFQLPDELTDENISDTRREALQLLHDHPRHGQQWYASKVGVNDQYIQVFRSKCDADIIRKIPGESVDGGGREYTYELTDEARAALIQEGVIDADSIDQIEAMVEEPSQRIQKGNATFEGVPLDGRDEGGVQLFKDRPAAKNAENGEHENGEGEVEEVSESDADESDDTITVELDPSDAFGLVHTADPKYARSLWRAVTGTDE